MLRNKKSNPVAVLDALMRELNIPVSTFTLKHDLEEHPNYPSLLAFSDCLNNWKVPHGIYQLSKDDLQSEDLSFPFISHFSEQGGKFILVHGIENKKVIFSDELSDHNVITEIEYLSRWNGIVLYAEKEEVSGESNYKDGLIKGGIAKAGLPFLILILLACILLSIDYASASWGLLCMLGLNLVGVIVSVFLLTYSIGANNSFVQNLCGLGKKNNCNTILKSDVAKVNSWLSWSEVGMFYFTGSFLCLIINPNLASLLVWVNLACLPYTFYSIGYQIKTKNWCFLCCTVQVLLWLEALVFAFDNSFHYSLPFSNLTPISLLLFTLSFLLPVAVWITIKPIIIKAIQIEPLKRQLKRFKYDTSLFNKFLTIQPRYAVPDEIMPIMMGNPDAETVITMVSNPFCEPCATAHKKLDEWLRTRDDIQLKIVFTTASHDDDARTKVARHISALSMSNDKELVEEALTSWYDQTHKNYKTWAEKYPVSFNDEISLVTKKQKEWCEMADITATPTILVNGYKLTVPYRLDDIRYLID